MDFDRFIASPGIRVASLLLIALGVGSIGSYPMIAVVAGVLAAFGAILSFHSSYDAWLPLAERIQKVVTTVLFGACYLLIVPLFSIFVRAGDPLRLRESDSSWVTEQREASDAQSYQRMG